MPTEKPELLLLIENDKMLQFIKSINNVMDITIDVNDNLGFPLVEHNYYTGFCKYICSTEKGLSAASDLKPALGFTRPTKGRWPWLLVMRVLWSWPCRLLLRFIFGFNYLLPDPPGSTQRKTLGKMLKATSDLGFTRGDVGGFLLQIKVINHEKCAAIST